ncbi:hypothetical protein EMCRGX_G033139 [Ephydatia muelleri]
MIRVVKEGGPSLVGRDWLKHLQLDWKMVCNVQCSVEKDSVWQSVLSKYSNIFKPGLGMMKEITAKLKLKPGAVPQFHRARSVPFSLKGAVEQEIHRLEELGVLERVVHSEWAAPIVVVPKKDGRVRLCGDYKVTVNKFLDVDQYPLPKPNELFATLTGGKRFTKLDLSQAYTQMVLEEAAMSLLTLILGYFVTLVFLLGLPRLQQYSKQLWILSCKEYLCQEVKVSPPVAPLNPWVWPAQPWQRIHIDFAGPFLGSNFLVVVDAHSKWPEVVEMKTLTSAKMIEALRELFATYGLPQQLVSDNGSQFTSEEFAQFMTTNGIKHICCAPYHPASNGLAERFVQTFKKSMLASRSDQMSFQQRLCSFLLAYRTTPSRSDQMSFQQRLCSFLLAYRTTPSRSDQMSFQQRLCSFLLAYRTTPHSTTGVAPCMLFFKRQLRTRLDPLKPDYGDKALGKQADQKNYHDLHSRDRQFSVGQKVMAQNFLQGLTWVPGVVKEVCGPVSYMVRVQPNIVWRRHVNHIKELQEFDALRGGEEDSLRKEPVLENCAEETSIVDKPSASDSVISAGVPQEGLCPDIQVPTTEIAVQQDPGSTSDISIEQSRSAELREPSKSTELGREIATRGDVPKLASWGSGSEDHQQQTAQPEGGFAEDVVEEVAIDPEEENEQAAVEAQEADTRRSQEGDMDGSTVLSDEWSSYSQLTAITGNTHLAVNHSLHFVDPTTGAHTQMC